MHLVKFFLSAERITEKSEANTMRSLQIYSSDQFIQYLNVKAWQVCRMEIPKFKGDFPTIRTSVAVLYTPSQRLSMLRGWGESGNTSPAKRPPRLTTLLSSWVTLISPEMLSCGRRHQSGLCPTQLREIPQSRDVFPTSPRSWRWTTWISWLMPHPWREYPLSHPYRLPRSLRSMQSSQY